MNNEFKVSDYKIFEEAVSTSKAMNESIKEAKNTVDDCKTYLSNEAVFMGPIAEQSLEGFANITNSISVFSNNCNTIEKYLTETAANYKSGDAKATSNILNIDTSGNASVGSGTSIDMTNYPTGSSREDGIARATLVAKYLMAKGGFTAEQAAALAGVYLDENNCDPGEVMEAEKNGQGVEGTGGNGYGAGIASWTFEETKRQALIDAGFDPDTPIENLSMQQQCDMIIAQSQKSDKIYYDALKRCDNIEDASATAVIMTGGVGFSDNWDTHPTAAEAKELSDWYGRSNDANFGESPYHWNLDVDRLNNAKEIYEKL